MDLPKKSVWKDKLMILFQNKSRNYCRNCHTKKYAPYIFQKLCPMKIYKKSYLTILRNR